MQRRGVSIAELATVSNEQIAHEIFALYSNLPQDVLNDLHPLALGNCDHVARIRKEASEVTDLVHNENIAVGRGFDWLHLINRALIIGLYGHAYGIWREAIGVAGKIVLDNIQKNT